MFETHFLVIFRYFVTYDLVCDTDPQQRAEWDQRLATCQNVQSLGKK